MSLATIGGDDPGSRESPLTKTVIPLAQSAYAFILGCWRNGKSELMVRFLGIEPGRQAQITANTKICASLPL